MVSQSSGWREAHQITDTPKMSEKRGSLTKDGQFYYWAYQKGSGMYFFKAKISDDKIKEKQDAGKMLFPNYSGENNPYEILIISTCFLRYMDVMNATIKKIFTSPIEKKILGRPQKFWVSRSVRNIMTLVHLLHPTESICFLFRTD